MVPQAGCPSKVFNESRQQEAVSRWAKHDTSNTDLPTSYLLEVCYVRYVPGLVALIFLHAVLLSKSVP